MRFFISSPFSGSEFLSTNTGFFRILAIEHGLFSLFHRRCRQLTRWGLFRPPASHAFEDSVLGQFERQLARSFQSAHRSLADQSSCKQVDRANPSTPERACIY